MPSLRRITLLALWLAALSSSAPPAERVLTGPRGASEPSTGRSGAGGAVDARVRCVEGRGACACFAPGTSEAYMSQFHAAFFGGGADAYSAYARWSTTASGYTGATGSPITLTWSFVPDGSVPVPAGSFGAGVTSVNNVLFAAFDAKFGSRDAWQDLFRGIFADWSERTGVTFVEESADDGATWVTSPGALGVRGDIRIIAIAHDGPSGVLAFNYYPDSGDMALDKDENWANPANDYRFLRNVVMHELGHGLGLQHVLPRDGTKLMEALLTLGFVGPQDDDQRGAGYYYGDPYEVNDSVAVAANLGAFSSGQTFDNMLLNNAVDRDHYRFSAPPGTSVVVDATPLGGAYSVGPDPGTPTPIDTRTVNPLRLDVYDSPGATLLRSAVALAAGQSATTLPFEVPATAGGGFLVRVSTTGATQDVQRYRLTLTSSAGVLRTLSVASTPIVGAACTISPPDALGKSAFVTPSTLTYAEGQPVTLNAAPVGTAIFKHWELDGVAQPAGQAAISFVLNADRSALARYQPGFSVTTGGDRQIVPGELVTLSATASGGTAPLTFTWSPADGLAQPNAASTQASPLQTTTYTVTARDALGLEAAAAATVMVLPPLSADAGEDRVAVAGSTVVLEARASGGSPPYSVAWTPAVAPLSADTFSATVAKGTTFTLTVTDSAGRSASDGVRVDVVEPLAVDAGADPSIVIGSTATLTASITGGAAPYAIAWLPNAVFAGSGAATIVVAPPATTLYTVTVTDASGQAATDQVRVEVVAPLTVSAAANPPDLSNGESTTLVASVSGGSPPYSFDWSPTDDLDAPRSARTAASPGRTTEYTVVVRDARGRGATATVFVQVDGRVLGATVESPLSPRGGCGLGLFFVLPLMLASYPSLRRVAVSAARTESSPPADRSRDVDWAGMSSGPA